jgi:hypothetical protein
MLWEPVWVGVEWGEVYSMHKEKRSHNKIK